MPFRSAVGTVTPSGGGEHIYRGRAVMVVFDVMTSALNMPMPPPEGYRPFVPRAGHHTKFKYNFGRRGR